ncbi:MAG: hypothetical protein V9E83_05395 [Baekduia sp.]
MPLVGAAFGLWANTKTREFRQTGTVPKLINWQQVRTIAVGHEPGRPPGRGRARQPGRDLSPPG